jgi:cytochrome c oxidase subunit 4
MHSHGNHGDSHDHSFEQAGPDYGLSHHVVPIRTYLLVFTGLLILTAITVAVAFQHLGDPWNDVVAMAVATTKATLVVLFFMHVKWSSPMVKLSVVSAVVFLLLLFGITWSDYWAREAPGVKVQETVYEVRQ